VGRRGRSNKNREPITVELTQMAPKGAVGLDEKGRSWRVWGAPIGATVTAWPGRKQTARRIELLEAPPNMQTPPCPIFGLCGGCQFQEMGLDPQRAAKLEMVERLVGHPSEPIRGADQGYGYRNKLELSFGVRRYLPEAEKDGESDGTWLGFHPPGWFSKIVPVSRCELASEGINEAIAVLFEDLPQPAWDNQSHTGHWRHVVFRQGEQLVVNLVTHPDADEAQVMAVAQRLGALEHVGGVVWTVTDRMSDVASGETAAVLYGESTVDFEMNGVRLRLPHQAFFQVNTDGARILFETIREALGPPAGATLLDLYCGVGAIGLVLGREYERILGVELVEPAIEVARENAAINGIESEWYAGTVESVLPTLELGGAKHVVVDPPRAGLHPKAALFLATLDAEVLVYVACSPTSLGRDRLVLEEGGWSLERLWTVDLFPQTPHVEAVARFVRR
jgi:23S rRNA (uracil1939-C5)-methyltransferase